MAKSEDDLSSGIKGRLTRAINEFRVEANELLGEVKELKTSLLEGSDEQPALKERIEATHERLTELGEQIDELHQRLFAPDSNEQGLADEIKGFLDEYKETKEELDGLVSEVDGYRDELLGYEAEDGTQVAGVKDTVEETVNKFNELYKTNSDRQEELFQKIEGMLKGASTVALGAAFQEHRLSFANQNKWWLRMFIGSVIAIMLVSLGSFIASGFKITEMWKYSLGFLPFVGGAIWLAIYASRQRSENKRLEQEFAHKEDVAKIYYGLKKEIEELGETETGKTLNQEFIRVLVETVAYNPSETLDSKSHKDNGPVMELLDKVTTLVKEAKA